MLLIIASILITLGVLTIYVHQKINDVVITNIDLVLMMFSTTLFIVAGFLLGRV